MNTFIKNNWFKLAIAISILIIAVVAGYYFVIYLPKEKADKDELSNQIKCQQEGTKLFERDVEEAKNSIIVISVGNPEFKFNNKMNTCLYKAEEFMSFSGSKFSTTTNFIKDAYTNKEVFRWAARQEYISEKIVNLTGTEEEWNKKYNELFEK